MILWSSIIERRHRLSSTNAATLPDEAAGGVMSLK
jgi:hypothetical protein